MGRLTNSGTAQTQKYGEGGIGKGELACKIIRNWFSYLQQICDNVVHPSSDRLMHKMEDPQFCANLARNSRQNLRNAPLANAPFSGFLTNIRESETTIKIIFALFRGGGWEGGQGGKLSKTLFFMGNVMTIKFWKCKFYCREILLSWRRLLKPQPQPQP